MKTTPKSRLLLLELIFDFLIFALCAAVCVVLLLKARAMSRESADLTNAVYLAQSALEAGAPAGEQIQGDYTLQISAGSVTVLREGTVLYTLGGDAP